MEWFKFILEFVSGMTGVFLGVWLQNIHSLKMQKEFTNIQFKINKLSEVATILSDYIRDVVSFNVQAIKLSRGQITYEVYKQLNDEHQERIMKAFRILLVNRLFLDKNHYYKFEYMHSSFTRLADKTHYVYYNSDPNNRYYSDEEITEETLLKETHELAEYAYKLLDSLNVELSLELKKLV